MFLEYAISSVWALMLYVYLKDLFGQGHEFSIGLIMACGGLGSILGPFIMGQVADRYFATERSCVQPSGRGLAADRRLLFHHLLADFRADAFLLHALIPQSA